MMSDRGDNRTPATTQLQAATPESMTLGAHLRELRRRVLLAAIAVTATGVLAFVEYNSILSFLLSPYCGLTQNNHNCTLLATSVLEGLDLRFKVSLYSGLALAAPVVFWQLWAFIAPALHAQERKYSVWFIATSTILFASGATIAYLILPNAFGFLRAVGGPRLTYFYTASNYLSFILALMASFGLAFEFPVLLVALQLVGIVTPAQLAAKRRWAIVAIFAAVALVIPSGDPISLFAMAIPMILFYEASIVAGRGLRARSGA